MEIIESVNPFLMQLFIVPFIVIGLGIFASILAKKVLVAPSVTLVLNLLYETWDWNHYYPESPLSYTSWNIIFPIISFVVALIVCSAK